VTTTEYNDLTVLTGTAFVPRVAKDRVLARKEFVSDQEVRWCPGCGDYAILAAFQSFLPELGIAPENIVVVSGIGCSSRFPYYVESYGMHSIHGRAPSIATGVATAREDLSVWVMTGDGDALAIGGNHFIHALRRNVNLNIVMFNNEIYGLTKGQYSPTSPVGTVSKSTPFGSVDHPFNPIRLALGADATFVARTMASDRKHLTETLRRAALHRGGSFVEVLQNCVIFNDGTFDDLKSEDHLLRMEPGQPLISGDRCIVRDPIRGLVVVPTSAVDPATIVKHDPAHANPGVGFALASIEGADSHDLVPIGIFRDVVQPSYDDAVREQIRTYAEAAGGDPTDADIETLLAGRNTWKVSE
jgi:2-oxoglutarate ferredoxin oxidoreductase subunit beta